MAAPAQASARNSAQPPALRPQAGNDMTYFRTLGDVVSRWSTVEGEWKRSSPRGKRSMRGLPRVASGQEVNRLSLLAHAEYWMGVSLDARNICPMLSLTNKKELDQRLSDDMPDRAMFSTVHKRRRHPPPRTANTRFYVHGAFRHTVWSIAEDEGFASSAPPPAGANATQIKCPEQRRCQGAGAMYNVVLRDIPPLYSSLSLASASPPGALCSLDSFVAPPRLQDRLPGHIP